MRTDADVDVSTTAGLVTLPGQAATVANRIIRLLAERWTDVATLGDLCPADSLPVSIWWGDDTVSVLADRSEKAAAGIYQLAAGDLQMRFYAVPAVNVRPTLHALVAAAKRTGIPYTSVS